MYIYNQYQDFYKFQPIFEATQLDQFPSIKFYYNNAELFRFILPRLISCNTFQNFSALKLGLYGRYLTYMQSIPTFIIH